MLELLRDLPIFIGFKLDGSLRRQLESISGPDRKYVSSDDSTYLRICRSGEDRYVGKLIHEQLTIQRVDDIRRNIVSILNRILPEVRLPHELVILACASSSERMPEPASSPESESEPEDRDPRREPRSAGGNW